MKDILEEFTFSDLKELIEKIEKEHKNPEISHYVMFAYKEGYEAGYKDALNNK